ncbi:hypothetical protein Val02_01270 [Virgisporangium aliadipatigenens]|uniref:Helix-turn-helix domain-containing protein n=1 Tax=Virgisporangium aliadipatigenens TaxID=741659 RepID=A0A8J4DMX7_9ACTN|nr:hypothetical protein [Virgisporangium aliadipatigenens]GIJ43241.1 hypothetical protein Val02_01270 [Virgisporangium aliadipatigenens]
MSGYTVTIAPHEGSSGAHTTIEVDTAGGQPRVTEVRIRATGTDGLSAQQLPVLDLVALLSALGPAGTPALPAPQPAPVKAAPRRARRSTKAPEKKGRAYRKMPDQDEVVAAWNETGKVSAVAEHFGVPRHTATGWLRRLRGLGVIPAAR